jgi:hypothetical protein
MEENIKLILNYIKPNILTITLDILSIVGFFLSALAFLGLIVINQKIRNKKKRQLFLGKYKELQRIVSNYSSSKPSDLYTRICNNIDQHKAEVGLFSKIYLCIKKKRMKNDIDSMNSTLGVIIIQFEEGV